MNIFQTKRAAKICALILAISALFTLASVSSAAADAEKKETNSVASFTENGVTYLVTGEDTVAVTGFKKSDCKGETITLDTVTNAKKEYKVTAIYSMKGLDSNKYTVSIGENVTYIANKAFSGATSTTIDFDSPEKVKEIGSGAFKNVLKLDDAVITFTGLTMVGGDAFAAKEAEMPEADKNGLVLLEKEDGKKILLSYEGEGKEVTLNGDITVIAGGAFAGNEAITKVTLGKNTVSIGDEAFSGCKNLAAIEKTDKVSYLGRNALKGTKYYSELKAGSDDFCRLSENKESAGYHVIVKYTGSLVSVTIPEGSTFVYSIFDENKTKIESISIPASVVYVGAGAFEGCSALKEVLFSNNTEEGAKLYIGAEFLKDTAIESLYIPTQTTSIDYNAFEGSSIKELQVGNEQGWVAMGGNAFEESEITIGFDNYTSAEQQKSKEDEKGLLSYVNVAFGYVMKVCSFVSGGIYLIALFLFAVLMKVILFPFGIKQQKSMVKQAAFRPKEMAIQAKYRGRTDRATMQKMQQEIMEARQKENISMFGGCLPLLLQLPILLILFNVIMNPLQYICGATTGTVEVLTDRAIKLGYLTTSSGRDVELVGILSKHWDDFAGLQGMNFGISDLPNFSIGAFDLSEKPVLGLSITILVPIFTFLAAYFSSKLTRKLSYQAPVAPGGDDAAVSMKIMDFAMPALSTWISFMYPAVIGCYWIFQNILSVLQQWILKKMYPYPEFTEEDYKKAERELMGKAPKARPGSNYDPNKPKVRSLHHIDDDDDELPPAKPDPEDDDDDKNPPATGGNATIGRAELQ